MTRRKPHELDTPKAPVHWRSLEDKHAPLEKRLEMAESERPGGFLKGTLLGSKTLLKKSGSKHDPMKKQPKISRRGFLASSSAAAGALTLQGCVRRPVENILPYVEGPEYLVPGVPLHFATTLARGADALGVLVTQHVGRPTKIEGNADHPSSTGATDARAQITLWDLYDSDRSHGPAVPGDDGFEDKTFAELDEALDAALSAARRNGGRGLRILMPPTPGPSVLRLLALISARLPEAKVHYWTSVNDDSVREGSMLAFGQVVHPVHDMGTVDVAVALDSDFLGDDVGGVRNARAWGARRAIRNPDRDRMPRLYVAEAGYSITGGIADHRFRVAAQDVGAFLKALAAAMEGRNGFTLGALAGMVQGSEPTDSAHASAIDAMADDLCGVAGKTARGDSGRGLVVVGPNQPAWVHGLAHAINQGLQSVGSAVKYYRAADGERATCARSVQELVAEADSVETLLILGGNPVYDAPADVDLRGLLDRDGVTSFHLGYHRNETSERCTWHVPEAHELETWGDHRAIDGTLSIQQPLIAPLFGGRSAIELLARAAGERNWRGHSVARKTLRARVPSPVAFERQWRRALHRGIIAGTSEPPVMPALREAELGAAIQGAEAASPLSDSNLEVRFVPSAFLYDGRHSNNLWALECPDPITKLVWDNAALMSRTTRDALGFENGQMISLSVGSGSIELPVWAVPGHANHSITLTLGWGRTAAGRYGNHQTWPGLGVERDWEAGGFDVGPLRTAAAQGQVSGVSASSAGGAYDLVQTQTHGYMEGRPVAIDATLQEYREHPDFASYRSVELISGPLWTQVDYAPREVATGRPLHKWGMTIDLSACTGCNVCVVACQAENNIPAVGKQEVKRGREMHWMRIDRYFMGNDDDPGMTMQPVTCQQCELAPCENVCPVNATAHSPEGLNDMAYNRCIGTRYCANNCPYKVRRFNYLDWHNHLDDPWGFHGEFSEMRQMMFNPNVTVRMRGVMEKCTYCVQRIQEAKLAARREHRELRDGDIVTACQSACPSGAIVFGDLNDSGSRVARLDAINRRYKLLAEIGTQPRTTYLGKIRNPNPLLVEHDSHGEEVHG